MARLIVEVPARLPAYRSVVIGLLEKVLSGRVKRGEPRERGRESGLSGLWEDRRPAETIVRDLRASRR